MRKDFPLTDLTVGENLPWITTDPPLNSHASIIYMKLPLTKLMNLIRNRRKVTAYSQNRINIALMCYLNYQSLH